MCVDLVCPKCGAQYHVDGDFLYGWTCTPCGTHWRMGTEVSLTEVGAEEADGLPWYSLPGDATNPGRQG